MSRDRCPVSIFSIQERLITAKHFPEDYMAGVMQDVPENRNHITDKEKFISDMYKRKLILCINDKATQEIHE